MHPTISCDVAGARIADLHHQAQRDTLARAARGPGGRRRPGSLPLVLHRARAVPLGGAQVALPVAAGDTSAAPLPHINQISSRKGMVGESISADDLCNQNGR